MLPACRAQDGGACVAERGEEPKDSPERRSFLQTQEMTDEPDEDVRKEGMEGKELRRSQSTGEATDQTEGKLECHHWGGLVSYLKDLQLIVFI